MTDKMQRKCGTCATINDEKDLFCGQCRGILARSTLIDGTIEPQPPMLSGSSHSEKEISKIEITELRPTPPVASPEKDVIPAVLIGTPPLPSSLGTRNNSTPLGGNKRLIGYPTFDSAGKLHRCTDWLRITR